MPANLASALACFFSAKTGRRGKRISLKSIRQQVVTKDVLDVKDRAALVRAVMATIVSETRIEDHSLLNRLRACVRGDYEIPENSQVAKYNYGVVCRAKERFDKRGGHAAREVAIKAFDYNNDDPTRLQQIAMLRHPGLVETYALKWDDKLNVSYVIMPYLRLVSLTEIIRIFGKIPRPVGAKMAYGGWSMSLVSA